MYFKRKINSYLEEWKIKQNRKPLILRGARQVGKTTLVYTFAKSYKNFVNLNLERKSDRDNFNRFQDVKTLIQSLLLSNNISSTEISDTLLFIDEIQESTNAISMLRYFYEDAPDLHVIAAGSLLEYVMKDVKSFPVGRVEYACLYPLNFIEYLEAKGELLILEKLKTVPVSDIAHQRIIDVFKEYVIIGGMPEVISTYFRTENIADLPSVYESIWGTYKNDIEKYASGSSEIRVMRHIMNTAHLYLDQRIKFENFGKSNYRSREVGEGLRNLNDARIVQLIYPTTETIPPIKPNLNKSPRLQFLDTGLVNYELNLLSDLLATQNLSDAYRGAIIPHIIIQEIISLNIIKHEIPNFWVREKNQSSSEVDLVISYQEKIIPIEIKSGKSGKLRSLHQFVERVEHPYAIRIYGGEFSVEEHKTPIGKKPYLLMNLPYYLGTQIHAYISFFIANYHLDK